MTAPAHDFMLRLREALAASWDSQTAYLGAQASDNPALGQCYPTARTVQHYYPATDIIKGQVWTGITREVHFWNGLRSGDAWYHIDLTWQQFPPDSVILSCEVIARHALRDSEATQIRCALLLARVEAHLSITQ